MSEHRYDLLILGVLFAIVMSFPVSAAAQNQPPAKSAAKPGAPVAPPEPSLPRWVALTTDSPNTVREIIRSEVHSRDSFSTRQEEKTNLKAVEDEKEREDTDYKNTISTATKEFIRAKQRRDDLTTQFHSVSTDLDESAKGIKTIRATLENLDGQISRYEQDVRSQQESLSRWLQTEKQGEIIVAVIYTRGFRDSAHQMEGKADISSAPLIASHMGTYIQSFTKVINSVSSVDFIRATEEGTAKWNNEEPLRLELDKTAKGTTYLRLKRYELYPFQENKTGKISPAPPESEFKAGLITSKKELDAFLKRHRYNPANYDLTRAERIVQSTLHSNAIAEEGLNEQVKSFQDRMIILQKRIAAADAERETQKNLLKRREENYYRLSVDVAAIRERKEAAERAFVQAQAALQERKRVHEAIIIKTALATTKGSQSPAEASAEVILDKLEEVRNDAKTQHSTTATEVTNFQVTGESASQSITEARITAIRLIAFVNEGESVRVKMAFRVRTVLEEQPVMVDQASAPALVTDHSTAPPEPPVLQPAVKSTAPTTTARPDKPKPVVPRFKRTYKTLAVKGALGCLFELRAVTITRDGLRVLVEVVNNDETPRKVAFYDDKFGTWTRSRIQDEKGKSYPANEAYAWQGSRKTLMIDIDRRGRGIEIQPQTSVTVELVFKHLPRQAKKIKIHLHPFIYYQTGWRETWQEFDLELPEMRLK